MHNRRDFLKRSAIAATLLPVSACSGGEADDYEKASARLRAPLRASPDFMELVRFATLAPNGHNTQPWRFAMRGIGASISPDFSRRTPVVDPDDHHLFVSLGCAAENFLIAGAANGRPGSVAFETSLDGRIDIDLGRGAPKDVEMFRAIPARQSTRSKYDGRPVSLDDLKRLEAAAAIEGVRLILLTDKPKREPVLNYLTEGNNHQMNDPAFVAELLTWIRFNAAQALETGDGLFSKASGSATLPAWIGKRIFSLIYTKDGETAKYTEQMRSSAGIAVFIGDKADKEHWVKVGRSFQRFALMATALGIRHAHINQLVEVPAVRADFARWLGIGDARPDLVVRFGMAPALPMSMRRPVTDVVFSA